MKKINIENIYDVSDFMFDKVSNGCRDVTFVGLYEDAVKVVKGLLFYDETNAYQISIEPEDWNGYEKEYFVTLDDEMNVWCEKAYSMGLGSYLYSETGCALIADDCNPDVLKGLCSDEIYEVGYDDVDIEDYEFDDCNGCCECCDCNEEADEELLTDSKSESAHISVTKDGRVAGFSKSWSNTDVNGMSYYSSYSHYSSNEDSVKKLAREFGIDI